jgi:hypothetical protein
MELSHLNHGETVVKVGRRDGSRWATKSRSFDSAEVRFAQDDKLVPVADLGFLIAFAEALWRVFA